MIFVHDKIYARVWKVTKAEKYIDMQITTSEKDRDGNYINSGWFPRAVGHAFNTLKDSVKEGDRIVITKAKLSNERYKDESGNTKSSFRFVILEAEVEENREKPAEATSASGASAPTEANTKTTEGDPCPW